MLDYEAKRLAVGLAHSADDHVSVVTRVHRTPQIKRPLAHEAVSG
ncbi:MULTISPECIES: hypothetical protein [unclassified Janthinobacterium]|nr:MULTISPECIES: hypothetical protein [unclassified Janthinobacterium]